MKNSLLAKAALIAAASMVLGVGCHKHRPIEGDEPQVQAAETDENKIALNKEVRENYDARFSADDLSFASRIEQIGASLTTWSVLTVEDELSFTILMRDSNGVIELSRKLPQAVWSKLTPQSLDAKLTGVVGSVNGVAVPAINYSARCMDASCNQLSIVLKSYSSADALKADQESPAMAAFILERHDKTFKLKHSVGGAFNLANCTLEDRKFMNSEVYFAELKRASQGFPAKSEYISKCKGSKEVIDDQLQEQKERRAATLERKNAEEAKAKADADAKAKAKAEADSQTSKAILKGY